jgi:hypothetical protein
MLRQACVELGVDWDATPIDAREAAISAAVEAMVERKHNNWGADETTLVASTKAAHDFVDLAP